MLHAEHGLPEFNTARSLRVTSLWWGLLLLLCCHFAFAYGKYASDFLDLDKYVAGQTPLPYQARALAGAIMCFADQLPGAGGARELGRKLFKDPRRLQIAGLAFASLLGSVLTTRASLARLTGSVDFSRWASLLVVYMAYFNYILYYGPNFILPYDLPSLFFFCLGMYLVISNKSGWYYACFVVAVLNRETVFLLTIFFLIWHWHRLEPRPASSRLRWLAPHWLAHHYANNPKEGNGLFLPHFEDNFRVILKPYHWPNLLSNYGFTLPLLVGLRSWIKNRAISQAALLPLWFVVMMVLGVIIETRIFGELISYMALAVGLILYNRWYAPGQAALEGHSLQS